jgi:16S rRNA processing protein RimM
MPSPAWDELVLVGRITKPHGLRGHVAVAAETDFVEERFRPGATFRTLVAGREETLTLASARVQNSRPIVSFEGYSRIEDVERLLGGELRVPEASLQPLGPGVYYEHQLVGCAVETVAGEPVGTVARVQGGAAGSLLTIEGPRGEVLVPLVQDICVGIDVAARRITIEPPDGLLELNEKKRSEPSLQRRRET